MTASPVFRRSSRTRKPTAKVLSTVVESSRVEKRHSPRLALLSTKGKQITTRKITVTRTQTRMSEFIDDHGSEDPSSTTTSSEDEADENNTDEDESDFEESCPSSPESEEHATLTGDNIEFMAADPLDRRDSYDSRLDPDNEDYLLDDFFVGDTSEDEVSTAGSEITIDSDSDSNSSGTNSDVTVTHVKRRLIAKNTTRKVFKISIASSGSGLLINDDEPPPVIISPVLGFAVKTLDSDVERSDVTEEINDAICRFSRRCNRHCPPLRLELPEDMFNEREVADAMERGINLGLGKYEPIGDGKALCTTGPPSQ